MRARLSTPVVAGPGCRYSLAGLTIDSELPLPELLPAEATRLADVRVRVCCGFQSPSILDDLGDGWWVSPDSVLFEIPGTGRYLVRGGMEILIDPASDANPASLRLFLLGSAFGALFHQRGLLPLHAGGVVTRHGCCAFGGDAGAGKSTLTAHLRARGYRSLADDVLALDQSGVVPMALPGFPQTKLWADAADKLGVDLVHCEQVDELRDKYYVEIERSLSFCDAPQPFWRLYVLAEGDCAPTILQLGHAEAMAELTRNTYRAFLLEPMQRLAAHFAQCANLVGKVGVFRLTRRRDYRDMQAVLDLLEAHFDEPNS